MAIEIPAELRDAMAKRVAKKRNVDYYQALLWVDLVARIDEESDDYLKVVPVAYEFLHPLVDILYPLFRRLLRAMGPELESLAAQLDNIE